MESRYDVPASEQLKFFTQEGKRGIIKNSYVPKESS